MACAPVQTKVATSPPSSLATDMLGRITIMISVPVIGEHDLTRSA